VKKVRPERDTYALTGVIKGGRIRRKKGGEAVGGGFCFLEGQN